jgi:hypothetical protein
MAMRVTFLPLEVRSGNVNSREVSVYEKYTAAHLVVDHPNVGGGFTVNVYGKDLTSGYSYSLLSSNIVASGHTLMKIGPDYTAGANVAKEYIPYTVWVGVTASGVNAYSIGASII